MMKMAEMMARKDIIVMEFVGHLLFVGGCAVCTQYPNIMR
jgi:hypothetical protein